MERTTEEMDEMMAEYMEDFKSYIMDHKGKAVVKAFHDTYLFVICHGKRSEEEILKYLEQLGKVADEYMAHLRREYEKDVLRGGSKTEEIYEELCSFEREALFLASERIKLRVSALKKEGADSSKVKLDEMMDGLEALSKEGSGVQVEQAFKDVLQSVLDEPELSDYDLSFYFEDMLTIADEYVSRIRKEMKIEADRDLFKASMLKEDLNALKETVFAIVENLDIVNERIAKKRKNDDGRGDRDREIAYDMYER